MNSRCCCLIHGHKNVYFHRKTFFAPCHLRSHTRTLSHAHLLTCIHRLSHTNVTRSSTHTHTRTDSASMRQWPPNSDPSISMTEIRSHEAENKLSFQPTTIFNAIFSYLLARRSSMNRPIHSHYQSSSSNN